MQACFPDGFFMALHRSEKLVAMLGWL